MNTLRLSLGTSNVVKNIRQTPTLVMDVPTKLWQLVSRDHNKYQQTHRAKQFFDHTIHSRHIEGGMQVSLITQRLIPSQCRDELIIGQRAHLFSTVLLRACQLANHPSANIMDPRVNILQEITDVGRGARARLGGIGFAWPNEELPRDYGTLESRATAAMRPMARVLQLHMRTQPKGTFNRRLPEIGAQLDDTAAFLWTDKPRKMGFGTDNYDPLSPRVFLGVQRLNEVGMDWPRHLLIAAAGAIAVAHPGEPSALIE